MGKVNTDCFGYSKLKEDCAILKKLYCRNEKCKFYKTRKEFELGHKIHPNLNEV